jgi:hypothetical protein
MARLQPNIQSATWNLDPLDACISRESSAEKDRQASDGCETEVEERLNQGEAAEPMIGGPH